MNNIPTELAPGQHCAFMRNNRACYGTVTQIDIAVYANSTPPGKVIIQYTIKPDKREVIQTDAIVTEDLAAGDKLALIEKI